MIMKIQFYYRFRHIVNCVITYLFILDMRRSGAESAPVGRLVDEMPWEKDREGAVVLDKQNNGRCEVSNEVASE
jgi:hypothetical protein